VGIVFRDSSEAARGFMTRFDARWPAAMDPGEAVAQEFGIYGPPETFFIDRQGVVRGRQIGQLTATDLERQLGLALANAPEE
jgi:cytochrome c biogenesis protein CcmG/thiol:disulfide interchange protein DsbE